ncbi:MAG: hypothetical protein ACOCP8_04520 [archaeon]
MTNILKMEFKKIKCKDCNKKLKTLNRFIHKEKKNLVIKNIIDNLKCPYCDSENLDVEYEVCETTEEEIINTFVTKK